MNDNANAGTGGNANAGSARRFVGACPDAVDAIQRTPGPYRVMIIGAHPDDPDIVCGCLTVRLIEKGIRVRYVSLTDGCRGHHRDSPDVTARRRREETLEAAKRFGLDGYDIYGHRDCELAASYQARCQVARAIREYEPDFIITHRTCDYHVDHRTTGQLVMDAGYLLGVPHWLEDVKAQRRRPVILYMSDSFTVPRELRPDVMIDAEPYLGRWCEGLDAQVSQFYEWLPWDLGIEDQIPNRGDIPCRDRYLVSHWAVRKVNDAIRFASAWQTLHPSRPVPKYAEAYEVSEYGRAPSEADLAILSD